MLSILYVDLLLEGYPMDWREERAFLYTGKEEYDTKGLVGGTLPGIYPNKTKCDGSMT